MTTVHRNEAVRAQIRVMMADGAGPTRDVDALADAVISLVLEAMGFEPSQVDGLAHCGPDQIRASTRHRAAVRAAPVVDRLEPLTAVARAADRYGKAVRKHKGEKKARRKLLEAVTAWKESSPA